MRLETARADSVNNNNNNNRRMKRRQKIRREKYWKTQMYQLRLHKIKIACLASAAYLKQTDRLFYIIYSRYKWFFFNQSMKIYAHALRYRLIHFLCSVIYYGYSCILVVCLTKECKGTVSVIYIFFVVANARTARII